MAKTERPGFRSYSRLDQALAALGLLLGAQLAVAPASAQSRNASLGVTATVLPSCVVSTQGGSASTSCSNFGEGTVRIERERRPDSFRLSAPAEPTAVPTRSSDVNFVTITY